MAARGDDASSRRSYSFCDLHLVHNCKRCNPASSVEELSASFSGSAAVNAARGEGTNMAGANYEDLASTSVQRSESVEPASSDSGARPRSVVTVRRSHTSPDTLLNRATNRPIVAAPASAEERSCHCKGTAKKGTSVRKSLDAFFKSTRRRLQARSRRTQSPTVADEQRESDTVVAPSTVSVRETTPPVASNHSPGLPPSVEMLECRTQRPDTLELEQVPHLRVHTTVDYFHYLVPGLTDITNCGFYWGVMDRYKAEALLENKPEGTFLLRDSSQDDFIFSVSFRRYGRSLHARVEQCDHRFSFDAIDSGVFKAASVTALLEHYKDPMTCMFFEPMLTLPLNRPQPFSLLHLARSVVCDNITYDCIDNLRIPKDLQRYLKYYHYKHKVRVRTDAGWVDVNPNGLNYSHLASR